MDFENFCVKENDKGFPVCLFVATPLFNLNIKGAKVWSTGAQDGECTAEEEQDMGGTDMEMRKMPREENMLVICEVFRGLRESVELHTRDDGTGFSASLILIPSLLHYSFKAGQEKKTESHL